MANRRKHFSRLGITALVTLVTGGGVTWYIEQSETIAERESQYRLPKEQRALLRHGDIILRRGYGMVSRMIATRLEGVYALSHCGVVIERDSRFYVVHTVSSNVSDFDGMQIHSLDEFVRQSKPGSIAVTRLNDSLDVAILIRESLRFLEAQVPFDHDFDLHDASTLYCSEMIWRALKEGGGHDIYAGLYDEEGAWYSFDAFFNRAYFTEVFNQHKP
ncbi:MAG: YiiX/YebB-like N1pC/P60 family cysteine hydrolase [Flavobacteriales bacterium]